MIDMQSHRNVAAYSPPDYYTRPSALGMMVQSDLSSRKYSSKRSSSNRLQTPDWGLAPKPPWNHRLSTMPASQGSASIFLASFVVAVDNPCIRRSDATHSIALLRDVQWLRRRRSAAAIRVDFSCLAASATPLRVATATPSNA